MAHDNPKHIRLSKKDLLTANQIANEIEWVLYDKSVDAWGIRDLVLNSGKSIALPLTWEVKANGKKVLPLYVWVRPTEEGDNVAASVPRHHEGETFVNMNVYIGVMLENKYKRGVILSIVVHELTHLIDPGMPYIKTIATTSNKSESDLAEYYLQRHEIEAFINNMWIELRGIIKEKVLEFRDEFKKQNVPVDMDLMTDYLRKFYLNQLREQPERIHVLIKAIFGKAGYAAIMGSAKAKKLVMSKIYDIFLDLTDINSLWEMMREKGAGRKRPSK